MPTHISPSSMNGVNFQIESVPLSSSVSRMEVIARGGNRIAAAGIRAIISRLNTDYGTTLSAVQVTGLQTVAPGGITHVGAVRVMAVVYTQDILANAGLAAGFQADLQVAGGVVAG